MRLGPYRLLDRLGAGGISVVYRAVADGPEQFTRTFALKRLNPELCREPEFVRLLVHEARVTALLHHPAIAQVFDFGHVGAEYYIVMELVEGVDLARVLRRCALAGRPPAIGAVLHLVTEVAAALAYAHELVGPDGRALDIVHRDVSPSNVMVTPGGDVKLIDFGIALAAAHFRDDKTATGLLKGKLGYLSPEQAAGARADRRCDLFALGVVLWEALTLRRLFRGVDALDTLRLVREASCPPPSILRPDVPAELDAVVMRLLARDPAQRFQSGHEVVHALRAMRHELQGDALTLRELLAALPPEEPAESDEGTAFALTGSALPLAASPEQATAGEERATGARLESALRPAAPPKPSSSPLAPHRRWPQVALALVVAATAVVVVVTRPWQSNAGVAPNASAVSTAVAAPNAGTASTAVAAPNAVATAMPRPTPTVAPASTPTVVSAPATTPTPATRSAAAPTRARAKRHTEPKPQPSDAPATKREGEAPPSELPELQRPF